MDSVLYQIRKEMLLKLFDDEQYKPMKLKELCMVLGVPKSERSDLKLMLDQMISEGLITIENKGRYIKMPPDQLNGTFMATQKGFGFVRVEGMADDIFIPEEYTKNAFHEDKVSVKLTADAAGGRRAEGVITAVLERTHDHVVGTYQQSRKFGFVVPDNKKIYERHFCAAGAVDECSDGT